MTVSAITPTTHNRKVFNERIAASVAYQSYPVVEHLFDYSDGAIGDKLNALCARATGDIIMRFDSDDFYSHFWVQKVIEYIQANPGYDVYGLRNLHYTGAWFYMGAPLEAVWGATMAFTKKVAIEKPFRSESSGEDYLFCLNKKVAYMPLEKYMLCNMHDANTCKKDTNGSSWRSTAR